VGQGVLDAANVLLRACGTYRAFFMVGEQGDYAGDAHYQVPFHPGNILCLICRINHFLSFISQNAVHMRVYSVNHGLIADHKTFSSGKNYYNILENLKLKGYFNLIFIK
jgi:hypothetical protein